MAEQGGQLKAGGGVSWGMEFGISLERKVQRMHEAPQSISGTGKKKMSCWFSAQDSQNFDFL